MLLSFFGFLDHRGVAHAGVGRGLRGDGGELVRWGGMVNTLAPGRASLGEFCE